MSDESFVLYFASRFALWYVRGVFHGVLIGVVGATILFGFLAPEVFVQYAEKLRG